MVCGDFSFSFTPDGLWLYFEVGLRVWVPCTVEFKLQVFFCETNVQFLCFVVLWSLGVSLVGNLLISIVGAFYLLTWGKIFFKS